jgi:hypothetical protein
MNPLMQELEEVLTNWIDQALDPRGDLPRDSTPARFAAQQFVKWWCLRLESSAADLSMGLAVLSDAMDDMPATDVERHSELLEAREIFSEAINSMCLIFGTEHERPDPHA